jgi:uncharacterized membrane protein
MTAAPPPDGESAAAALDDARLTAITRWVLVSGVTLCLLLVLTGAAVSFARPTAVEPGAAAAFPHTLGEVFRGVAEYDGQAIIVAGLAVLLLTPILRVALAIPAFLLARDWTFALISAIVLTFLLLSLFIGAGEG